MKFIGKIPLFIVAFFAWVVIISSCANQGVPTGGPRDSIPPVLIETHPAYKALNYKEKDVRLTFNEYIDPSEISEELVVSPPLTKRPTIRTKSKTLIIQFNEDLQDSITYSIDFKNSVVDNNEQNPITGLRFSFSTGAIYDSLRVAGRVLNAFDLEPIEKSLIVLQQNLHDSAVFKVRPTYIAKTDENGLFMIDNIASGKYNLFSINDANSDLLYNEGAEEIAFFDSIIVPDAHFHEELDTLVKGVDSMLISGHTHFFPEPIYLRHFTEDIFEQYLDSYNRKTRYNCSFIFSESVKDTFAINLLNKEAKDWYILEPNPKMDTISMWISDTLVAKMDTLLMEVSYYQLDSLHELYVQKDTLEMNFKDVATEDPKRKRRQKDDEEDAPKPVPQFNFLTNIRTSVFELNSDILITSPEPVENFDTSKMTLFLSDDSTKTPLKFVVQKDTAVYRRYRVSHKWEPEANYTFEIDSAACVNIYGISSKKLSKNFSVREEDYYGKIILELTNAKSPIIVQLLKNSEKEEVLEQQIVSNNEIVTFDFLAPGKYKTKIIYDDNNNGKWDAGSYQDRIQPEKVAYFNQVIKVRSNWESKIPWDVSPDLTFNKNIIDKELEEQKRKEAEEKARKEKEQMNTKNPVDEQSGGNNFLRRQ